MIKFLSRVNPKKLKGVAIVALDFNTEDEWRMKATLPTVKFLVKNKVKILILSHLGRPSAIKIKKGKPKGRDLKLTLRKKASDLGRFLGKEVGFIPNFKFTEIKDLIDNSKSGSVFVLENLRFLKGEYDNDPKLASQIASLGDFYVNDAFSNSHRDDVSVDAITRFLPSYGGFQLEKEVDHLSRVMMKAKRPLVVVLGGGKAEDKLDILEFFRNKTDHFLLGGATANTMFWLQGFNIGDSVADREHKNKFKKYLKYRNVILPSDCNLKGRKILDVGPRTIENYSEIIKKAKTVIWNGPLGLIEKRPYDKGTLEVAKAIAENRNAFSLAGGGETVMFIRKYGLDRKFSFISTGGGAMLEFLAGKKLPGISALENSRAEIRSTKSEIRNEPKW